MNRLQGSCLCAQGSRFATDVPYRLLRWLDDHDGHAGLFVEVISHVRMTPAEFEAIAPVLFDPLVPA